MCVKCFHRTSQLLLRLLRGPSDMPEHSAQRNATARAILDDLVSVFAIVEPALAENAAIPSTDALSAAFGKLGFVGTVNVVRMCGYMSQAFDAVNRECITAIEAFAECGDPEAQQWLAAVKARGELYIEEEQGTRVALREVEGQALDFRSHRNLN